MKVVHIIHNIRCHLLTGWHCKAVDPPLRSERWDAMENKLKLVRRRQINLVGMLHRCSGENAASHRGQPLQAAATHCKENSGESSGTRNSETLIDCCEFELSAGENDSFHPRRCDAGRRITGQVLCTHGVLGFLAYQSHQKPFIGTYIHFAESECGFSHLNLGHYISQLCFVSDNTYVQCAAHCH